MRRRRLGEPSRRFVVDTSVLAELIIEGSLYREPVVELLERASRTAELHVTHVTLAELMYVASRIYAAAGLEDPNMESRNFVEWVLARARVVELDLGASLRAGELRKRLRIALPDCCAIAAAERVGAVALFLKPEKEMMPVLDELRELPVAFLVELAQRGVL